MSTTNSELLNVRQTYIAAYSWLRLFRNGVYKDAPPALALGMVEHYRAFMSAVVSFDNRHTECTGWRNPFRRTQFWTAAFDRYADLYIPF